MGTHRHKRDTYAKHLQGAGFSGEITVDLTHGLPWVHYDGETLGLPPFVDSVAELKKLLPPFELAAVLCLSRDGRGQGKAAVYTWHHNASREDNPEDTTLYTVVHPNGGDVGVWRMEPVFVPVESLSDAIGVASGIAPLDKDGKIPNEYIPDTPEGIDGGYDAS